MIIRVSSSTIFPDHRTAKNATLLLFALLAFGLAPIPATGEDSAAADEDGTIITLLSYNIHGISGLIAKDDPRDRMPTIGWLTHKYDVVLFQEDFEYHGELAQQFANTSNGYRGNGIGSRPDLIFAKLVTFPIFIFIPRFSPPYGAGLSTFVDNEHSVPKSAVSEAYSSCHGWINHAADCWSAKGYQRVTVHTGDGTEVDIYNTHLEAGDSEGDFIVRRQQLHQLADAMERLSEGRAVIVAGDFNTAMIRPADREMVLEFRNRLGLRDSGAAPELPIWRERDVILFREAGSTVIEVEAAGEALEFTGRGTSLSDHAALYARFHLRTLR